MTGRRWFFALLSALLIGAVAAGAHARRSGPEDPTPWDSVVVPGGFAALQHAARLNGPAHDTRTIPLLIEQSFAGIEGLRFTRNIEAHAALLRQLHRQASALSRDRTIQLAQRDRRPGEFDALCETLGLEYDRDRRVVRRRSSGDAHDRFETFKRAGLPMDAIVERLNGGASVSLATRDATAPLPLGVAYWQQLFDPEPPLHDLLWAILASRETSSLLYGLMGLDDDTLRGIQADPALAATVTRNARVLPTVAPALRIHGGRVVPPGGASVAALWEDLVGERLDRPAEFVNALLRGSDGRLAYFYQIFAALPPATAAWVAGRSESKIRTRHDMFRRVFERFDAALAEWRPDAMIQPPSNGPADVLFAIAARPDGVIAGPPSQDFWRRVFEADAWPSNTARDAAKIKVEDHVDAAALLELVCPDRCDPTRLGTFALVQREFPEPAADAMAALLSVGRARMRYPSLALEVERMRLGDPSVYFGLGSLASRIEHLPQPAQAVALVQLQSAIAVLSRLRAVGAPATSVREHARALAALPVGDDGFEGSLTRWLTRVFTTHDGEDLDAAALRWLAGDALQAPGALLEWEGLSYRVDIAATERARIRAAREKFVANRLATAAAFVKLADDTPGAVAAGTVDALIATINDTAAAAPAVEAWWTGEAVRFESFRDRASEITNTLRRARPKDRRRIERAAQSLRSAADLAAADALASLVYALALQDVESPYALSREMPRRHHLQPAGPAGKRESPWAVPGERHPTAGMRYISGSLLGFDAGLTELTTRRLAAARPEREPNMAPLMAAGLQRSAALTSAWSVMADDVAGIEAARLRGEAIVEGWKTTGIVDRVLTQAGIVGPRAGWLRWSLARGEPIDEIIRLEDLVRLGGWRPESRYSWGTGESPSMCLCLTMPAVSWEMRGQPRDAEAAVVTIVEPSLRVAIELHRRNLPAALAPGVLALLTTDLIDNATLPAPSDVPAIVESVTRVRPERFDDYIAAVAARGPLVVASAGEASRR